jgi:hypothetical protein
VPFEFFHPVSGIFRISRRSLGPRHAITCNSADAPRNGTGSRIYQEINTVFVDDPVGSPTTARPGRTADRITIFWSARGSGYRCGRLDLNVVSHQLGKRDLIFAHLCDYFSEDDFRLALSGDVQLVLKRFALREQFFKGGHFHLHYKKSFYEVVWVFDNVLINKGVGAEKIAFNSGSGLRERVSASRLPWLTDQACGTDGCRISGIPVCELRRSLQSA